MVLLKGPSGSRFVISEVPLHVFKTRLAFFPRHFLASSHQDTRPKQTLDLPHLRPALQLATSSAGASAASLRLTMVGIHSPRNGRKLHMRGRFPFVSTHTVRITNATPLT